MDEEDLLTAFRCNTKAGDALATALISFRRKDETGARRAKVIAALTIMEDSVVFMKKAMAVDGKET